MAMELMVALVLVGVTVYLVLQPIISGSEAPLESGVHDPSEAQFRKRASLLQLRDAEYEYAMGKLDEADFQALKREISSEALAAIRAEEKEAESGGPSFPHALDVELEEEIALARARVAGEVFCSQCGHPNPQGSRFCGGCGAPVQSPTLPGPT
jgi:cytochrome c-type biogenesis protein CcmI